jgi:3-oxoacyl-[acyl-carrier-protein] synthase III
MGSKITGIGSYLPGNPISNSDLAKSVPDVDSEWIKTRTGITQRYFASEGECTSHMALQAAKIAIADSRIDPNHLDLIIVTTTTPDNSFPSTATKVHSLLGIKKHVPAFDLQAVCAGFVYGLEVANNFILTGKYKKILLIGADRMSSILDMSSRNTCVLFGDGAGAIVLEESEDSAVLSSHLYSDGGLYNILYTDGGVGSTGTGGFIQMEGKEVFRHAIEKMSSSIEHILAEAGVNASQVDFLVPHQANVRIIDGIATKLQFPDHKIIKTISKHANCSAASIPLALHELQSSGKLKRGNLVLLTALGAGLTWGSAVLKF